MSKEIDPVQIVYVKVKLKISRHADVDEVIAECDYKFDHEDIWDTEIMEVL